MILDDIWLDRAREREIPVRIYLPDEGRCPVIVLSHATGGSREGYAYLGQAWSDHGYASVHLQHRGSDIDTWRGKAGGALPALRRAAADPQNAVDRVLDTRFALDRLEQLSSSSGSPLAGRLDLDRLGIAGHSFGAATALMMAGQIFVTPEGEERSYIDARAKCVLAMSSPRAWRTDDLARNYANIRVPCLHFTGTLDDSPLNDTRAAERRIPFDQIAGCDQILVVFAGGDHMVFAGQKRFLGDLPTDAAFQEIVRRASLSFWDAHLRGDAASASFLHEGGLTGLVAGNGTVEIKRP